MVTSTISSSTALERAVSIAARAIGTAEIASIALVSARGTIAEARGQGERAEVVGEVEEGWVYAKVVQEDGEMAWSSPVFVDRGA